MSFNESNTVEQMILDAVENLGRTTAVEGKSLDSWRNPASRN